MSGWAGRDLMPAWVRTQSKGLPCSTLVQLYQPETSDPIYFAPGHLPLTRDPTEIRELRLRWFEAVVHFPRRYLSQRASLFRTQVGFGTEHVWYPFHTQIDPNEFGLTVPRTALNRAASTLLERLRDSPFFRAWIYFAAAALVLAVAAATRTASRATWFVGISIVSYVAPLFFVDPAPDFRYVWWAVVACLVLPLTLRRQETTRLQPVDAVTMPAEIS
jgi:hypothetical protein